MYACWVSDCGRGGARALLGAAFHEQLPPTMSVLLCVMTYPGGNETLKRHWPFFLRQEADYYRVITTTEGDCFAPEGVEHSAIGGNKYIDGPHLPNRMLDTIEKLLERNWRHLIMAEYDCLWLKPIKAESVRTVAGHYAGGPTWGSKTKGFFHCPWVFARESAMEFLKVGRHAIAGGICPDRPRGQGSAPECSPDVFFAYCCERANIPVEMAVWLEYSRNSFDLPGHLEEARAAAKAGAHVIHGCKTKDQLDFILSRSDAGSWRLP